MSSGRTAGVTCRTTASIIACPPFVGHVGGRTQDRAPYVDGASPVPGQSVNRQLFASEQPVDQRLQIADSVIGEFHPPERCLEPVGQTSGHSPQPPPGRPRPPATRRSRRSSSSFRSAAECLQTDLQVLRLARDARRRGPGVGDPGMWRESGRVGHRHAGLVAGLAQRRAPGRGAKQTAAGRACVAQPDSLPPPAVAAIRQAGGQRTGGQVADGTRGNKVRPVGPIWSIGAQRRADAAVEAGCPTAIVLLEFGQRVLPVVPEPLLVQAGVEVIPRQRLIGVPLAGRVPRQIDAETEAAPAPPLPPTGRRRSARSTRRSDHRRATPAR